MSFVFLLLCLSCRTFLGALGKVYLMLVDAEGIYSIKIAQTNKNPISS